MRIAPGLEALKLPGLDKEICKYPDDISGGDQGASRRHVFEGAKKSLIDADFGIIRISIVQ
jgi:hypothetical protein